MPKVLVDSGDLKKVLECNAAAFEAYLNLCAAVVRAENRPVLTWVRFGNSLAGTEALGKPYEVLVEPWVQVMMTPKRKAKFEFIAKRRESSIQFEKVMP